MGVMTKKTDTYQSLSDELAAIVTRLQSEELSIDEVLPAYERGLALVSDLEARLQSAQVKIEALQPGSSEER